MATDDMQLLRDYVTHHSEQAFATLVSRHAGLVYSAALRRVENPQLAEEITQAVFIILVRKAAQLSPHTVLSGWLYRAACYPAGNAANCFFHCLRLCVLIPSSVAMVATDLPPWSTSSTAERLKFSSYRLYLRGSLFSVFMVLVSSSHNHSTLVHQFDARPVFSSASASLC
jgi:hypothetical protein